MANSCTTAILLAGGRGSRMNHQDKAWLQFDGKPMLQHIIEHIADDVDQILISRNRHHPGYDQLPYQAVTDTLPGFQGPLAGILSCINAVQGDNVLVLPCDVPVLPADLVATLGRQLENTSLAVATTDDRIQPLIFMAKIEVLGSIESYLDSGRRSVMGWLEQSDYKAIEFGPGKFENINEITQLR